MSPSGNDANDGLTSATAKKTLAAVMAIARCSDVVHAAPGMYDQGEITNMVKLISSNVDAMGSRVVIPEGVSLVADEGPEVTFIKGSYGSDSNGYGAGALRGVYMYEESVLEGFTITDCATYASSYERENSCGACVVAPKANVARPAVIRNCRLTGGRARSGAAAYGGVLERCRIDNCIVASGGLVFYSKIDNCLVVSTRDSGNVSAILNHYGARNSTIYVRRAAGDADFQGDSSATIENSIIYYDECSKPTTLKKAKNCIVKSVSGLTIDSSCTGIIPAGALSSLLDPTTYRPVVGSAAIDAGDMALFGANSSALDCGGGQRVYSGTVDVGAYEYSPLAAMGAALATKDVSVAAADASAMVGGGVTLTNGTLEAVWQKKSGNARCEVAFQVTGNGVLVVADETGVIGRYVASGEVRLMWGPPGTGAKSIRFTYQPAANEPPGAGAVVLHMEVVSGFVIIFR